LRLEYFYVNARRISDVQAINALGCTSTLPFRYVVRMPALPILYSFRRCPYAMRARMALIVSGITYEHREILLRDKPAAMLAASGKGTVPVLVLANGEVIDESIDIMRWALDQSDLEAWMASPEPDLVADYDGAFKHHLDRYKYAARYGEDPLVHRAAGLAMLFQLDERLGDRNYLGGSARAFGDIAIFPFVRQFAGVDSAWFEKAAPRNVQDWLERLISSDLFERAMARHRLWAADGS
jgi:glutathione S-transferase